MLTQYIFMLFVKVITAQVISTDLHYQNLPFSLSNLQLPALRRNVRQITSYQGGLANSMPSGLNNFNLPSSLSSVNVPNGIGNEFLPSGLSNSIYPNNGFVTNMGYNGNNFQDNYNTLNSAINNGLPSYFANNVISTPSTSRVSPSNLPFGTLNYNNPHVVENIPSLAQNMVRSYDVPNSAISIPQNGPRNYNALPSNIPQTNFGTALYNGNNGYSFANSPPNTLLLNNGGVDNIVRKSNLQVNNVPINGISTLNNIASNLLASSTRANGFDNRPMLDKGLSVNNLLNTNSIVTNANKALYNNGAISSPNSFGFYQNNLPATQIQPTNGFNWNNISPNNIQSTNSIRNINMFSSNDGLTMPNNNMGLPVTNIPCNNAYVNKGFFANTPPSTLPQNLNISPTIQSDMASFNNANYGKNFNVANNDFLMNIAPQDNWGITTKNFGTSPNNYQLTNSLPLNMLSQSTLMNLSPEYQFIN